MELTLCLIYNHAFVFFFSDEIKSFNLSSKDYKKDDTSKNDWFSEHLKQLRELSSTNQVAIGGLSGWASGFFTAKFGKATAYGLGISFLVLYISHKHGYVKIDFNRFHQNVSQAKKEFQEKIEKDLPKCLNCIKAVIMENVLLTLSFSTGFVFGLVTG